MTAQTELDFLRPHLVGEAGYSQEDIEAVVSSCEQSAAASFIQHLVALGLLSGSAARTLSAVQKGYATVPVASLLTGLRKPGSAGAEGAALSGQSMVLRSGPAASWEQLSGTRPQEPSSTAASSCAQQFAELRVQAPSSAAAPSPSQQLEPRAQEPSSASPSSWQAASSASAPSPSQQPGQAPSSPASSWQQLSELRAQGPSSAASSSQQLTRAQTPSTSAAPSSSQQLSELRAQGPSSAASSSQQLTRAQAPSTAAAPSSSQQLTALRAQSLPGAASPSAWEPSPAAAAQSAVLAASPLGQLAGFPARGAPASGQQGVGAGAQGWVSAPGVSEAAARAAFGSGVLPAGSASTASVVMRSQDRARATALRALESAIAGSSPSRDTLASPVRPRLAEAEYGTAVPAALAQQARARAAASKSSSSAFSLEELASARLKAQEPQPSTWSSPSAPAGSAPRIPRAGEQLGRYRLQETLGDGSTAMTFRAYHDALAIPVAIKVYRPTDRVADSDARARFISEARILAQLEHPNIVRVIDVEDQGELPFIVFEYVGAMTLEEVVRASGRLSEERCLRIGRQVSEALNVANARGLLHRDVKPANVLVRKDGSVKLADFGLARELSTGPSDLVCGTPAFMAPEAALTPGATDWRADMYGLGATLYFALTGRPPFERATPIDTVRAHIQEPVPPPSTFVPGLDARVEAAVMKMLEKNPQDRFPSWTEVLLGFTELERTLASPAPRRANAPGAGASTSGGVSQLMKSLSDMFRKPRA